LLEEGAVAVLAAVGRCSGKELANMLRSLDVLGHVPSSGWLLPLEHHCEVKSATHNLFDMAMADAALAGLRSKIHH
jgi:hypothetical protein